MGCFFNTVFYPLFGDEDYDEEDYDEDYDEEDYDEEYFEDDYEDNGYSNPPEVEDINVLYWNQLREKHANDEKYDDDEE